MKDTAEHLQDWLILHLASGIGPTTCLKLIAHFGSPGRVLAATGAELARVPAIRREAVTALASLNHQTMANRAAIELKIARQHEVRIIPWDHTAYPPLLRTIAQPPLLLYVQGEPQSLLGPALAVVGSRAATSYGRDIAARMASTMARRGFAIVSGLALGIDACAHQGAIKAGGCTVAVLGCGLDIVYPQENRALFKAIPAAGAIISEYPFGTKPDAFRFPARNRLISGLSLGVLVVEASSRSGSLITANHALEQGREVFAVPGRVDSLKSSGTHSLLQQGAKLVMAVEDIIAELQLPAAGMNTAARPEEPPAQQRATNLTPDEQRLLAALDAYPKNIDEIACQTQLPTQKASELLLLLELKDIVEALPGKCYMKKSF